MAENDTDGIDNATLRAFEAFFGTHLAAIVNVHRHKPWERAREDLFMAVKALNTILRKAAKIKGRKDLSVALVPQESEDKAQERLNLVLTLNGDSELILERFSCSSTGCYPIHFIVLDAEALRTAGVQIGSSWPLSSQEALIKRIWSHFEDPKCDLVKLLSDKYWP